MLFFTFYNNVVLLQRNIFAFFVLYFAAGFDLNHQKMKNLGRLF